MCPLASFLIWCRNDFLRFLFTSPENSIIADDKSFKFRSFHSIVLKLICSSVFVFTFTEVFEVLNKFISIDACARRRDTTMAAVWAKRKKRCKNPTKLVIKDRHIVGKKSRQVANHSAWPTVISCKMSLDFFYAIVWVLFFFLTKNISISCS